MYYKYWQNISNSVVLAFFLKKNKKRWALNVAVQLDVEQMYEILPRFIQSGGDVNDLN